MNQPDMGAFKTTLDFGMALPAESEVAHFVVSLAAAMNDLILTHNAWMPDGCWQDDPVHNTVHLRRVAAEVWEAHLLVTDAYKRPRVAGFIDRLASDYPSHANNAGSDLVAALRGEAGATAPAVRSVMRLARNNTNHYPEVGSSAITQVLRRLAEEHRSGDLTFAQHMPSIRAGVAEEVMLRIGLPIDEEELPALVSALVDSVAAIVHLAQVALDLYLADMGIDPLIEPA